MDTQVCPKRAHHYNDLVYLFNGLFQPTHHTVLVAGEGEPEYCPADGHCRWNRVIFAHGFFASALHEISHWCIAGHKRRRWYDYGYWYEPDGRTADQQSLFEQVEARPQALEWIFSEAAGSRFHLSLDNLSGDDSGSRDRFGEAVLAHAHRFLDKGLPARAGRFAQALQNWYGQSGALAKARFTAERLR